MGKILIVEDDLSIQALLHDFIQEAGHSVLLASAGAELALPQLRDRTGRRIDVDYEGQDTSGRYAVPLFDGTEEYTLFIAKNADKESQIIEALRKSIPIMGIIVFAISLVAAFFIHGI